jgi:hypothetical protein
MQLEGFDICKNPIKSSEAEPSEGKKRNTYSILDRKSD